MKKEKSKKQISRPAADMYHREDDIHRGKNSLQPTKRMRKQDLNWLDDEN